MASHSAVAVRRARACKTFLEQAHAATAAEGINPSTLHAIKLKLVAFAKRTELFPLADFAMPEAQGRNHPLLVEDDDGYGLYLTIGLPGKEAAPHDHGIWCANAADLRARTARVLPAHRRRPGERARDRSPRWARSWSSRAPAW